MIDTVRFRVTHPEVDAGSPFYERAVASDLDGIALVAAGSDGAAVGLRGGLIYRDDLMTVKASKTGLYVTTSLARRVRHSVEPNVFGPTSSAECAERIEGVRLHLEGIGLGVDLMSAGLSRVDLYRDAVLRAPYGDYIVGLQARDLQRLSPTDLKKVRAFDGQIPRASKLRLGAHTYGRTTTNRAIVTYNKTEHLRSSKGSAEYAAAVLERTGGHPIVRFESRFLNGRGVKGGLAVDSGGKLVRNWNGIADRYGRLVEGTLGTPSVDDIEAAGSGLSGNRDRERSHATTQFEEIVERHGRGRMAVLLDLALDGLASRLEHGDAGDIEHARAVYAAAGVRKRDVDRVMDDLGSLLRIDGEHSVDRAVGGLCAGLQRGGFGWPDPATI